MNTDSSIQELQEHRDENQVNIGVKLLEKFTKLEIQLIEAKSEFFQWMCFFWVTQMAVYVVMILLLLKK